MKITKIIKPKIELNIQQLEQYFCCCVPGREGKEHLDFCTIHEPNNVINGYAWNSYLTDKDYIEYKKSSFSDEIRLKLKNQIKNIINGNV